jgi:DNA modification methylase
MKVADVFSGQSKWAIETGCCLDVLRTMPANSVHCCITSPPYFALRSYLPAEHPLKGKEIGSESTPEAFTATMVAVFDEVRRVLRPDGVLWVNLGDSYCSQPAGNKKRTDWLPEAGATGRLDLSNYTADKPKDFGDLKQKDLCGIPWRCAFALQAAGWWFRSDIPWVKRSAMPESTTDRPAKSLEYVFMFTKSARYFYDVEAVRREAEYGRRSDFRSNRYLGNHSHNNSDINHEPSPTISGSDPNAGRNFRNADLWFDSIATPHGLCGIDDELVGLDVTSEALKEAHFAAYPTKLVDPLIRCGSSEKGCCPHCGSPWVRVVGGKKYTPTVAAVGERDVDESRGDKTRKLNGKSKEWRESQADRVTLGWQASCDCPEHEPIPCTILDPFCGAATTGLVALRLGRRFVGIELNQKYVDLGSNRIVNDSPLFNAIATEEPS